jgi:hypothetical protein
MTMHDQVTMAIEVYYATAYSGGSRFASGFDTRLSQQLEERIPFAVSVMEKPIKPEWHTLNKSLVKFGCNWAHWIVRARV